MGRISKQIGWSNEANLLHEFLEDVQRLRQDISRVLSSTPLSPDTTTTTTTLFFTPLSDIQIGFPLAIYRNYEGEEMLSTGDETAGTRDDWTIGTPISFKSWVAGTKTLTLTNVPTIQRMIDDPTDWAVADLVATYDISGSAVRIDSVNYLPDSGGDKGICEFVLHDDVGTRYDAYTSASRFVIFSPKSHIVRNGNILAPRGITGFTEKYPLIITLYRRNDGVWNAIVRGYRGSSYTPMLVYKSYVANDPMGTWTAEGSVFTDAGTYLANFKHLALFTAFIDVDGKIVLAGCYRNTSNVDIPCYVKMDKDTTNVSYHIVTVSGIDLSTVGRWSADSIAYNPSTDKYYLVTTPDAVYNSRRYILSSATLDGTFTVDEEIVTGTDRNQLTPHVQKPGYSSNLASLYPVCIGNEILLISAGEGSNRSGNFANHVVNMMRRGDDGWEWLSAPFITAYHTKGFPSISYIWGTDYNWTWDHCGLPRFCIDGILYDGKLYFTSDYAAGTDTYQQTVGYIDVSDLLIPSGTIVFLAPSSFTVHDDTKAIGLVQAKVNNSSILNNHVKYSIVGGADADKVTIRTFVGMLNFDMSPLPTFESPGDANGDNVYEIIVRASTFDGAHHTDQTILITVIE